MTDSSREPIISVLGHVDHGKTSLLDYIRDSVVAEGEAGGITQHIGATDIPMDIIVKVCKGLVKKEKISIPMRGLLFVDTPGHEAFINLRKRGGSVADLAVLVIDINEGLKPQTIESIEILKSYKTPFVVAANKVDKIPGWFGGQPPKKQSESVYKEYQNRIYRLIGDLSNYGFNCDIYNNIDDFSKSVAVVPVSAHTGDGVKELLMMLIGLAQTFLKDKLEVSLETPAKGTILEVKETKGLGTTIDAIIYDGKIKVNDTIVVAARTPIVTKIKALLRPNPLEEMRDPKKRFKSVKEVYAASGVKIVAPNLENAMSGGPIYVGGQEFVEQVLREIGEVEVINEHLGVTVKADTLGSLEAMLNILEKEKIRVKRASIGKVTKQDVVEACAIGKEDKYLGVLMAFSTTTLHDAQTYCQDNKTPIFASPIIYKIIEDYQLWVKKEKEEEKRILKKTVATPAKIILLPKHTFRASKPAIVGVEILDGLLTTGCRLMKKDGKVEGRVRGIQSGGMSVTEAKKGEQVAVSIDDVIIGKNISEGDTLYTFLSHEDIQKFDPDELSAEEKQLIKEIKEVKKQR